MCDSQGAKGETPMIAEVSILVVCQIVPLYFKGFPQSFRGDSEFNHGFSKAPVLS
jgi:hypothetical protein